MNIQCVLVSHVQGLRKKGSFSRSIVTDPLYHSYSGLFQKANANWEGIEGSQCILAWPGHNGVTADQWHPPRER